MPPTPPPARNRWIDHAKAIGIVLVVYGHVARGLHSAGLPMSEPLFVLVDSVIYSFHMPLFFLLSGTLFHGSLQRHGALPVLRSKVDSIVYPYLLWSLLQGGIEVVLGRWTNGSVTLADVLSLWQPRMQFWFLYALFFVTVLAVLVYRRLPPAALGWVALAGAGVFLARGALPDVNPLGYVWAYAGFFAWGVYFNQVAAAVHRWRWALLGPLTVLFVAGQWGFHGPLGLVHTVGDVRLLALAAVSMAWVVVVCMVLDRPTFAWLARLGTWSMPIYLAHTLASSGTRIALSKVLQVQHLPTHLVLGTAVGLLAPVVLVWLAPRLKAQWLFDAPAWWVRAGLRR